MQKKKLISKMSCLLILSLLLSFSLGISAFAADNNQGRGAEASYGVVKTGNTYTYTFNITNTSTNPNDSIYGLMIGNWFNEPMDETLPLQNAAATTSPTGWSSYASGGDSYGGYYIDCGTSWNGNAQSSNYILPGETATFTFTTSNGPLPELKFDACYFNGKSWGGIDINGTATLAGYEEIFVRDAEASYSLVKSGNSYTYTFNITNTSTNPSDSIYGLMIGNWFNEPMDETLPLQDAAVATSPTGWSSYASGGDSYGGYYIDCVASWNDSAQSSNYILPGETATFTFTTSNGPLPELKFGACYFNGQNWGGVDINRTATLAGYEEIQ